MDSFTERKRVAGSLRTRRLGLNVSQQLVAELADCSLGSVRLFESGYVPRNDTVVLERLDLALSLLEKEKT